MDVLIAMMTNSIMYYNDGDIRYCICINVFNVISRLKMKRFSFILKLSNNYIIARRDLKLVLTPLEIDGSNL